MILQAFLADLRRRDIHLWADGERLRCNAPNGLLTPALREQIQQRKTEILAFLRAANALVRQQRAIIPMQPRGSRTPIYAVAGHNGDVFAYRSLSQHLGGDQPFFGLQPPGYDDHSEPLTSVEGLATYFAKQIREFQPEGPYVIAGYCAGGGIAFELARHLQRGGATISFLALFACPFPASFRFGVQLAQGIKGQVARIGKHVRALATLSSEERRLYIRAGLRRNKARRDVGHAAASDPARVVQEKVGRATLMAVRRYTPGHFSGRVGLFLPNRAWLRSGVAAMRWRSVAGRTEEYYGPDSCNSDFVLLDPDACAMARLFEQFRDRCDGVGSGNTWTTTPRGAGTPGHVTASTVPTGGHPVISSKRWFK